MYNASSGSGTWHNFQKVDVKKLEDEKTYLTYHMTDVAIDMIMNTEEPCFMYKAWHAPHFPLHAPADLRKKIIFENNIYFQTSYIVK